MTYWPDVNVWIALAAERHKHHPAARRWFKSLQGEKVVFCRITQLGFLRLLTNRHVMQEEVLSPSEAWGAYALLRTDRRIGYFSEPSDLLEDWRSFTPDQLNSPNLWTDAYLCAYCHAAGFTLVTFDSRIPARSDVNVITLGGFSEE